VRMWLKPRSAVRGCQPLREGGFGPTRDDARGGHAEFFRASPAGEPPFSAENPRETDPRRAASPVGPSYRALPSGLRPGRCRVGGPTPLTPQLRYIWPRAGAGRGTTTRPAERPGALRNRESCVSRATVCRGPGAGRWPRRPGRTGGAGPAPRRPSPRAASPPLPRRGSAGGWRGRSADGGQGAQVRVRELLAGFPGDLRGDGAGGGLAGLDRGLCELGEGLVLAGDVPGRVHAREPLDLQVVVHREPAPLVLGEAPLGDGLRDRDAGGPDGDVGFEDRAVVEDHVVVADLLHPATQLEDHPAVAQLVGRVLAVLGGEL